MQPPNKINVILITAILLIMLVATTGYVFGGPGMAGILILIGVLIYCVKEDAAFIAAHSGLAAFAAAAEPPLVDLEQQEAIKMKIMADMQGATSVNFDDPTAMMMLKASMCGIVMQQVDDHVAQHKAAGSKSAKIKLRVTSMSDDNKDAS